MNDQAPCGHQGQLHPAPRPAQPPAPKDDKHQGHVKAVEKVTNHHRGAKK